MRAWLNDQIIAHTVSYFEIEISSNPFHVNLYISVGIQFNKWPLDSTINNLLYSKKKIITSTVSSMGLEPTDPGSMGGVAIPGGDLLDDLLTPCAGTLRTIASTIHKTGG